MQNQTQANEVQVQDQEIADVLGITVLSPLEESAVSGGEAHIHQGSQHVDVKAF